MNHGPLIFLAAFFALASSWVGFVLTPHLQVGHLQPTNTLSAVIYPQARPGLAQQGLQVYRANGCVSCHSQQVQQTGNISELMLFDTGTNHEAVVSLLSNLQLTNDVSGLPKAVWRGSSVEQAVSLAKQLKGRGAKASVWIVPVGPDLARGWGKRRTVAEDFLYDTPAMPGSQRIGPDLADVGSRLPDSYWHLRHLYEPTLEKKDSKMPPYRFLFQKRKIQRGRSPEALPLGGKLAPEPGYEVVPTAEAKALAAYLVSLRVDEPLFVAPFFTAAPVEAAGTNIMANTNAAASTNPPSAGTSATPTNATQK